MRGPTVMALVTLLIVSSSCAGNERRATPVHRVRAVAHRPVVTVTTTSTSLLTDTVGGLPDVISHGRRDLPLVALTFDSNLTTAMIAELDRHRVASFDNRAVIDELDALDVPATIFLAGKWMERYPEEVRRLAADPRFELGTHSYAHRAFHLPCYHLGLMPRAAMAADVERAQALLRTFTDRATPYFRFPGGCYDRGALAAIAPAGVVVIQYDVASGDAFGHSTRVIVAHVLASVRDGSIVVMHITGGNTAPLTAQALPPIVAGLRARGFRLVTVSQLLAAGTGSGP